MTRGLTGAVEAAIDAEHVSYLIFVELDWPSGTVRLCNAFNTFPWNGFDWLGLGNLGRIEPIKEGAELQMYGIEMALSGVNTALAAAALGENYQGRDARVWFAPIGDQSIESGTAQAGSGTTLTLRSGASAVDGAYNGKRLRLTGGAGGVQDRTIIAYNGTTKVATVGTRWRANDLVRSEDFSTTWSSTNATVVNDDATAPDGTATADKIVESGGGALEHGRTQTYTFTAVAHVFSVYARAAERAWLYLTTWDGVSTRACYFNLSTGTVGSSVNGAVGAIVEDQNGWFRCSIVVTPIAAAGDVRVATATADNLATYAGDGVSGIYAWGAQLEKSSAIGEYVKSVATAVVVPGATTTYEVLGEHEVLADPIGPFKYRMDVGGITRGSNPVITISAESPMADYDRPRVRRWTDEDQRAVYPDDTFFSRVPSLQEMEILF